MIVRTALAALSPCRPSRARGRLRRHARGLPAVRRRARRGLARPRSHRDLHGERRARNPLRPLGRPRATPRPPAPSSSSRAAPEFIEKNVDTYADLAARGYDVWTLDWRGQGLSDRLLPDPEKGHVDSYDSYLRDADQFLTDIVRLDQSPRPRILLAHSMGGGIGTLYLERHPGRFDKAVFASP